ncbi:MAG: PVC-type heme-binding CxxCH protein, partial [Verrucomicrobiota bacterium]
MKKNAFFVALCLVVGGMLAPVCAAPVKPVFTSKTVTAKTKGRAEFIQADITGAKKLFLVVESGGNNTCDWANWIMPRLRGEAGTLKLTEMDYNSAGAEKGKVYNNRNGVGDPLKVDGEPALYGIGTHANSVIEYDLPPGYTSFKAFGALDDSGVGGDCGDEAGVVFKVYTQKPPRLSRSTDGTAVPVEQFVVPEGLDVSIWATSPMLYNPANIDIDYKGRIWVTEGRNYRGRRTEPEGDRVVVLEDTDGDGVADSSHTFVQEKKFICPLGIAVIDNRIVVSQPPDLIVYTDVDRDAVFDPDIDKREVLLTGFDGKNHDHSLHSVTVGPNGQWYFNFGNKGGHVTDRDGWQLKAGSPYSMRHIAGHKSSDGHVYLGGVALRVNPDGTGMRPIGHNFRNSYEQTVTSFGDVFQNDNDDPPAARTTWLMEYGNAGYASPNGKRNWGSDRRWGQSTEVAEWRQDDPGSMPAGDVYGGGAPTGIAFCENGAHGDTWKGLLLSCEPARNTVFGYYPEPQGAGFKLERFDFMTTNPERDFAGADFRRGKMGRLNTLFRPSDVAIGPDGAIYVSDWFDARVGGHATHDKTRSGTIYRVAPKGFKPTVPTFDVETTDGQIAALRSSAVNVRSIGFLRLKDRGEAAVDAVAALLKDENPYIRARAIFLLAQLGPRGIQQVEALLESDDVQTRIAAFRSLRHIDHNLIPHAVTLSKSASPAARREAVLAMRDLPLDRCREVLLNVAEGYEGDDSWYLEAFGAACAGKEAEVYELLKPIIGEDPA